MIDYRPFRNDDPPRIARLWNTAGLGRGAALNVTPDAFDLVNYSQPYFDRHGLIVAMHGETMVGFGHAGFAFEENQSRLARERGVICAVVVDPAYRRKGVGRELIRQLERYLAEGGAKVITAGPAPQRDPYYVGLYGGIEPAGFLESDSAAEPFFLKLGYLPSTRHVVYQRPIPGPSDPVHFRLMGIRRKMELVAALQPRSMSWAWAARFGRLDSLEFLLSPKGRSGADPVAAVTLVGLDLYIASWHQRAVGLVGLTVTDAERRKGYGQALLLEIGRKLRDEMITCIEAHAPEENVAACKLFESCGYRAIERGSEYLLSRPPGI